jgi:NAD+ diphosphatase
LNGRGLRVNLARMHRINFYAGGGLDRASHLRNDRAWLQSRLAAPESQVVLVWRTQSFVVTGAEPRPAFLSGHETIAMPGLDRWALLGLKGEQAFFAVDISHIEQPQAVPQLQGRGEFVDLRGVGPLLPREEGSLLAYARGLMYWHSRHGFCGVCGAATESAEGGFVRQCSNPGCKAQHFPRTDPAVIMLVTDGESCLLGRAARFVSGMRSTLAGFVEPGESLEEAVTREVFEEAGIEVGDVRYHSSQPWPFPASIMLGFYARARSREIKIDPNELVDAKWYSRREVLDCPNSDDFRLPRPDSIARRLIEDWVHGRA